MALRIVTDSTCDLPESLTKALDITVVPLKVLFGEEVYRDGVDLSKSDFYKKMAEHKQLPTTAQVNPGEFLEVFQDILTKQDEIIGIFISSKLSGTYSSAVIAKEQLGEARIHLVDSGSTSFGLALLVVLAARMVRQNKTAEEIVAHLETAKKKILFYGVINTLENLKKGGRLSTTDALAGTLLGIQPIIALKDGEVTVAAKTRGQKKAFAWILDQMQKNGSLKDKLVFIAHAAAPAEMQEFKRLVMEEFNPKEIIELEIGTVVGTHSGPGCVGIGYLV